MITIVSLAYNQSEMTQKFVEKLKKYTDIPHRLVFTDNGSTEPVTAIVRAAYPHAIILQEKENIGCPATRNIAMQQIKTDICFWVDNDTLVGPNWYEPVMKQLEHDDVGISGPLGYVVKNPWQQPYPFERVDAGECDWFMGYLIGFKTKYYVPIHDYHIPVNLDDVECAWGIKSQGKKAVVSDPCFAQHLTSKTQRGWEFNDQEKLTQLWNNWPDKSIFVRFS